MEFLTCHDDHSAVGVVLCVVAMQSLEEGNVLRCLLHRIQLEVEAHWISAECAEDGCGLAAFGQDYSNGHILTHLGCTARAP